MTSTLETIKENKSSKILGWCGAIASVLGLLVALYFSLIKKDEPKFEYDIVSAIDFFNNSESVPYIKVFIEDSIDVQENHYNITAYNIKIENKGSKDISYHDYDEGFFGLIINNGTLLDVPLLLSASNNHIEKNFRIDTIAKGTSRIEIPKITLDVEDNYEIKIVLLHDIDSIPEFYPEGKISGQNHIVINEAQQPVFSFLLTTFGGNWLVQITRFFSYFLAGLLLLLGVDFLMSEIQDKKRKQERETFKQQIEEDKKQKETDEKKSREDEIKELNVQLIPSIKEEYINNGQYGALYDLHYIFIFSNESKITERYRKMLQFIMHGKNNRDEEEFDRIKKEYDNYSYYIERHYFILGDDISITFDNDARESVSILFDFLYEKGKKENTYRSIDDILNTST